MLKIKSGIPSHKHKKGKLGLEIECEFNSPLYDIEPSIYDNITKIWRVEEDGSLKGYSNEFVIKEPCSLVSMRKNIINLKNNLNNGKVKVKESVRAGVHVHLNVQELTPLQVFRLGLLFYILETPITKFCGENRVGNLFCLRYRDAEYIHEFLVKAYKYAKQNDVAGVISTLSTDYIRYAALNYTSLIKYGSIEFRCMETRPNFDGIEDFLNIILALESYAINGPKLGQSPEDLAYLGPDMWMRKVRGPVADKLMYPGIDDDIMTDFRYVQHLLYKLKELEE